MVPLSTFRTLDSFFFSFFLSLTDASHTLERAPSLVVCAGLQRRGWNPVTDWRDLKRKEKKRILKRQKLLPACLPACLFILPKHTLLAGRAIKSCRHSQWLVIVKYIRTKALWGLVVVMYRLFSFNT
jgi:hypothetical protein